MPSSTSSFERYIPDIGYSKRLFFGVLAAFLCVVIWELVCRSMGYKPVINDDAELWVSERKKLDIAPDSDVVIGASRILFGLDLDLYESAFNTKPIQLSTIGINPTIYLEHLAEDPKFVGKVLVGYSPGLYFASGGGPVQTPKDNIYKYENMSWSDELNFQLAKVLDKRLAFIQPDDLALGSLMERIPVANREGTQLPPALPPYFYYVDERRMGALGERAEVDSEFANEIVDIWLGLMAPHDTHLPESVRQSNRERNIQTIIDRSVKSVNRIREKGGDVVFVRYPSTGSVRELEAELNPRDQYWDRLIQETNAYGIHFEDYESLKHFECPEGGHISKSDRGEFTSRIIPLLKTIYSNIDSTDIDQTVVNVSSMGLQ